MTELALSARSQEARHRTHNGVGIGGKTGAAVAAALVPATERLWHKGVGTKRMMATIDGSDYGILIHPPRSVMVVRPGFRLRSDGPSRAETDARRMGRGEPGRGEQCDEKVDRVITHR